MNPNSASAARGAEHLPMMGGGAGLGVLDDHIYQRLLRERIVFLGSEVRDQNALSLIHI